MSQVLDYFRDRFPALRNADDAELTAYVASKKPEFLQDPEFARLAGPMLGQPVLSSQEIKRDPNLVSTTAGGPPVQFGDASGFDTTYADTGEIIPRQPGDLLVAPSVWAQRGGKLLLGAMADLASTMKGEPSMANIDSYANNPAWDMPVETGLQAMHGLSSVPTKVAAGLINSVPALGLSAGMAEAGAPAALAAGAPVAADQEGHFDPLGVAIASGLPGASKLGEQAVGKLLAKVPTAHVVAEVLSRDPLKLKAKVVQRIGGLEISNDSFRKYLEAGGGAVAANAYLLAAQAPQIMALPKEQRGEAILNTVAANIGPSLLAYTSRTGTSETLNELRPKLQKAWEHLQNSRAVNGAPAAPSEQPAAPESQATITGSNEGQASEMPAEVGVTPAPESPMPPMVPEAPAPPSVEHPPAPTPPPATAPAPTVGQPEPAASVPAEPTPPPAPPEQSAPTPVPVAEAPKAPAMMTPDEYATHQETLAPHERAFVAASNNEYGVPLYDQNAEVYHALKQGQPVAPENLQRFNQHVAEAQAARDEANANNAKVQLAAPTLAEGKHYLFDSQPGDIAATPKGGNVLVVQHYDKLNDARQTAARINEVRPNIAKVEPWLKKTEGKGGKRQYTVLVPNVSQGLADQLHKLIAGGESQAAGAETPSVQPDKGGWTKIGVNADGAEVFQDSNGVRSTVENGVRITEPVHLIPTREGIKTGTGDRTGTPFEIQGEGGTSAVPPPEPLPSEQRTPAEQSAASQPPGRQIADYVHAQLTGGAAVDRESVTGKGTNLGLTVKETLEWAELGATLAARDIAQKREMTPQEKFAALVNLYERMPTNGARTLDTKVKQQYSTPPPLAYAAGVLADFANGTMFVEPTAGHGMLMIGANPGADMAFNELDENRTERLKLFAEAYPRAAVTALDATGKEFHDRAANTEPDRVGMNPPFGTVMGKEGALKRFEVIGSKIAQSNTTSLDTAIMLNTFDTLAPGGKGFAIIGAKTGTPYAEFGQNAERAKGYRRPLFLDLFNRFNVVDWFTIGGDLYRKMGAAWPVDVIVVHGRTPTAPAAAGGLTRPWVKPPRVIDSWEQLAELLPKTEYDNVKPGPIAGSAGGSPGGTRSEPRGAGAERPGGGKVRPAGREQPPADSGAGRGSDAGPVGVPNPSPQPPESVNGVTDTGIGSGTPEPRGEVVKPGATVEQPGKGSVGGARPASAGSGKAESGQQRVKPSVPVEGLPAALDVPYQGASKGPSLNLVAPRNIANAMLAAQHELEKATGMSIDAYLADRLVRDPATLHKQLAGAQVDAVALAIRNIERGGALITADQTGVGKGRMVAALIIYCKLRGLIPVFVTAKKNLYEDMVARDLPALGEKDFIPFITDSQYVYENARGKEVKGRGGAAGRVAEMESIVRTGNLPGGAHGIFTTYDQLKGDRPSGWKETPKEKFKRKNARQQRPDGPRWAMLRAIAPRAIFILDEAHEASGPTSELNMKFSSVLPNAHGSYYSSATFAKRPDNMGLYALGTSIRKAGLKNEQLAEALQAGGVPLQQALTSMLANSGELVRRQQDWTGVPFEFKQTSADPAADVKAADTYTAFIRDLMQLAEQVNGAIKGLEDTENQVRGEEQTVSVEPITFGSRLFNLSNQYLLALRSDAIVREAKAELKAGRKPFIALYNTMEGPLLDLKARKLPLSFNGILLREMQKMLEVTVRDPQAKDGKTKVQFKPEDLADGGAFYHLLEEQIMATDFSRFPISPIDFIKQELQKAGFRVGELTARDGEVNDEGGEVTISKREKLERNRILKMYNDGLLDVIIVNGSGSTGLSAHTDPRFKDQRQRVMIIGQPAPDINQFMQMIGRIMRSGQTSKPRYIVLNSALAAERRFATMLRGKMTSLNANTTAEGESGMTQQEGFADDIFNAVGDAVVERVMQANPRLADLMDLKYDSGEGEGGADDFARSATGRFVLLPNADAQKLWDDIIGEFKAEIQQLDERGENPLRAAAEDLRARTVEKSNIVDGTGDTPFDGPAVLEKCVIRPPQKPPTYAEARQRASDNRPTIKQAVTAWLEKSKAAEDERLNAERAKGATPKELERTHEVFQRTRVAVVQAFNKIGDAFAVDLVGDGTPSLHGVAAELDLADKANSHFSSMSRQRLVLTTNTYKGRLTLPLSKLFDPSTGEETGMLQLLDDSEAAELFDKNAESSTERYIVTGNLLRGWEAAVNSASGAGARPRVAMFTREDGSLATGILMPPAWNNEATPGALASIASVDQFIAALKSGITLESLPTSKARASITRGGVVSLPANAQGRRLWGDPAYGRFFAYPPEQRAGNLVGQLDSRSAARFFEFLQERGVQLGARQSESADFRSGGGAGGSEARGGFVTGVTREPGAVPLGVKFGGMQHVRALELPELVRLTRELSGDVPNVKKLPQRGMHKTLGRFSDGMITLDPLIFRDSLRAAQVLAHEIGHLADYVPHDTLRRGNLLGHLLALRKWMRGTFGALNNKELRAELLKVTMWWRPYDEAKDPKSYVKYRQSAEELYADALSVMFNAPAEMEKRAPKFYAAFWKELDRRPPVRDALFAIQDLLNRGMLTTAKAREEELVKGFRQGEEIWRQAVADRRAAAKTWKGWWTRLWQEMYWNFYPLEQRAGIVEKRGAKLPTEKDPRKFLDDLGYRDVQVLRWGRMIYERVIQPIEDAGMTLEDAGRYLFYNRIYRGDLTPIDELMETAEGREWLSKVTNRGDRELRANPHGFDAKAAQLGLLKMRVQELGLNKMTVLQDALQRFYDENYKLTVQAVAVGAYNAQTHATVVKPNKDHYATFAVLDYLDDYVSPTIRAQIGTLKGIANPFHATILKSMGLINLIAYQKAKNLTVDFIGRYFPDDIERTEARHEPTPPKGKGVFMRLENGRPVYYFTDPFIADAFTKLNTRQLGWFTRAANGLFRSVFYPLFITYNPAFLYFMSPLRDIQRAGRNLPGTRISVGGLPRDYLRNLRETGKRYMGDSGPLIREMEANLGLGTPFDQIARTHRDDFMADLLRKMRVLPDHEIQGIYTAKILRPIRKMLNGLEAGGMTLDALAKTASYAKLRREGMAPNDAAHFVRNYVGLPNINKKGLLAREARALVPFWNVFVQGWRADLRLMTHPTTRAGWWMRYVTSNGFVRAFIALAAAGVLGQALKELFDGISEYNKTNYLCVPVGAVEGGDFGKKTMFIRIPENETDRILGGIIYKGITTMAHNNPDGLAGIFDFGAGQFPSVNPALQVSTAWLQFAEGHNPMDWFRSENIVPDRKFSAGGWEATKPMIRWTLQQSGALNFVRYDPNANSTWELGLSATPGVNSFVKVSDAGYREQQRTQQQEIQAQRDMQFLKLPDKVQSLEMEYWRLERLPKDGRTPPQADRLADLKYWYSRIYRPAWEGITDAVQNNHAPLADRLRGELDRDSAEYYRRRK